MSRRAIVLLAWAAFLALGGTLAATAHYTADLSAFLPSSPTPAQALLVEQLREGPTSRVILVAIERADGTTRAALSRSGRPGALIESPTPSTDSTAGRPGLRC